MGIIIDVFFNRLVTDLLSSLLNFLEKICLGIIENVTPKLRHSCARVHNVARGTSGSGKGTKPPNGSDGGHAMLARQAEKQLRGVQRLPARQVKTQLCGLQPLSAREVETRLRCVQPLPSREAEKQLRCVQPLPARQGEIRLRGLQPLPSRDAETQLCGVQPLPSRQAEGQLRSVQPLPPRQAEKELRGVQVSTRGSGEFARARARDQAGTVHHSQLLRHRQRG